MNPQDVLSAKDHDDLRRRGYEIFTVGPLYYYGGLKADVFSYYAEQRNLDTPPFIALRDYNIDLFELGPWSRIIFAIPQMHWTDFHQWLTNLTIVDSNTNWYMESILVQAPVVDPIALLHSAAALKYTALPIFVPATPQFTVRPNRKPVELRALNAKKYRGATPEDLMFDSPEFDYTAKELKPLGFYKDKPFPGVVSRAFAVAK